MKKHKPISAILLTFFLLSCGDNQDEVKSAETPVEPEIVREEPKKETQPVAKPPKETHVQLTKTEDKLIDRIWQLPEVKALADKVEKESKGKRHLTGRISSMPSDDQEYYGVSISEDNGEAMATYFEFRIYPDNSIYYYDAVEDKEWTLKEWRAQN